MTTNQAPSGMTDISDGVSDARVQEFPSAINKSLQINDKGDGRGGVDFSLPAQTGTVTIC